jgi:hypothetical protein
MKTVATILSLAILFLAGCASTQPAATTPTVENSPAGTDQVISIELRKTGGFAGVDESWQIASDGRITTSEGKTGQVSTSDLNAAVEQLAAAGFFDLKDSYVPQDTCCDRFTYQLTVTVDGKPHSVTILEAAPETPDQFWKALEVVNALLAGVSE